MYYKFVSSTLILLLLILFSSKAQNTNIFLGTQIPIVYSLGIEQELNKTFAINLQGGLLASPYDKAILNVLKAFGTEEVLVNTIGEAFSYGMDVQVTPTVRIQKWYAGIYYSFLSLKAKDAPRDLIENYYGITIPDRVQTRDTELMLKSNLNNTGILIGRNFSLKNPKLELRAEISFAKTITSKSELANSNDFVFENLSASIDEELSQYYKDYGYIPSLNIFLVYKLVSAN